MRIGIPKGLLYCKYHAFFTTFFSGLGADVIVSEETNKKIMDLGVHFCVDEACLPVKVYHGHVASIKDRCDFLIIPRIMGICEKEYICPKFCGLPEMITHSIPSLPKVSFEPLYMYNEKNFYKWCLSTGSIVTRDRNRIKESFHLAKKAQYNSRTGICETDGVTVMLAGHPYIVYDRFLNMDIIKKLRSKGIGIITEEYAGEKNIHEQVKKLIKKPFWTFQRRLYGAAASLYQQRKIDGLIYLSSFACGIDSILIDLIRYRMGDLPMLVMKLDEHTGEAGMETRLEAFIDMLERRISVENNNSTYGECLFGSKNHVRQSGNRLCHPSFKQ